MPSAPAAFVLYNAAKTNGTYFGICADFALEMWQKTRAIVAPVLPCAYRIYQGRSANCAMDGMSSPTMIILVMQTSRTPAVEAVVLARNAGDMDREYNQRVRAEAAGKRYCIHGKHVVEKEACTTNGQLFSSCNDCRTRRRANYAATAAAADEERQNVDHGDGAVGDDDADGVQVIPPDEYDIFFGDGSDMDFDLPDDAAVNSREAQAIKNMTNALAALS
ncbi:hypothetical protein MVEN_01982100 [Mycena venus]|uniref:Uncharacterized protein n=1 Tax=Mycena venus TaxID=2733690 RepID=A0A8H6XE55_9AGAR|nr:hypothetical protein MVEN_01982100 [Mycena venus]